MCQLSLDIFPVFSHAAPFCAAKVESRCNKPVAMVPPGWQACSAINDSTAAAELKSPVTDGGTLAPLQHPTPLNLTHPTSRQTFNAPLQLATASNTEQSFQKQASRGCDACHWPRRKAF
jgi:hypothetical protein